MINHYIWWIPATILYYACYTWLSKYNNDIASDGIWYKQTWFWIMFIYGALCPLWLIISRISKNLIFDGMLYDNIMFLTYAVTMAIIGSTASNFSALQWTGFGAVIIGSVLMRIGV